MKCSNKDINGDVPQQGSGAIKKDKISFFLLFLLFWMYMFPRAQGFSLTVGQYIKRVYCFIICVRLFGDMCLCENIIKGKNQVFKNDLFPHKILECLSVEIYFPDK